MLLHRAHETLLVLRSHNVLYTRRGRRRIAAVFVSALPRAATAGIFKLSANTFTDLDEEEQTDHIIQASRVQVRPEHQREVGRHQGRGLGQRVRGRAHLSARRALDMRAYVL